MIYGIGVDIVDIVRFHETMQRTPSVIRKFLLDSETSQRDGRPMPLESLAARVAAKEAVTKALGCPGGTDFVEIEVVTDTSGKPELRLHGGTAVVAEGLGVARWHVSLSHDGGNAIAFVVAEKAD